MKPFRSRATIIWWTEGGLTRKWRSSSLTTIQPRTFTEVEAKIAISEAQQAMTWFHIIQ